MKTNGIQKLKLIAFAVAIILGITALSFGVSKFILNSIENDRALNFNQYIIKGDDYAEEEREIVETPKTFTGKEVKVNIESVAMVQANDGKSDTAPDKLTIQYYYVKNGETVDINNMDPNNWVDYTGEFAVTDNGTVYARLVTKGGSGIADEKFEGPISKIEITNIAVAKIVGTDGRTTYFKTLEEAIAVAGTSQTTITMVADTEENVTVPSGKEIILDLNGYKVAGKDNTPTITVEGKLNLIDSGKDGDNTQFGEVSSTNSNAIKVTSTGEVTLGTNDKVDNQPNVSKDGPVIKGGTNGIEVEESGKLNFYDGKVSGKDQAIKNANVKDDKTLNDVVNTPEKYLVVTEENGEYEVATLTITETVTFNPNGGTVEPTSKNVIKGKTYGELPTAIKEGYDFVGWSRNIADEISNDNYTITNYSNRTTSEIKNDGIINDLTNQTYVRINGYQSETSIDTAWRITSNDWINVEEGKQYVFSFYARSENGKDPFEFSSTSGNETKVEWNNGQKEQLSTTTSYKKDGTWQLIQMTVTVPSGVTKAKLTVGNDYPNLYGINSYIDIAAIQLTEGTEYTPIFITPSTTVTIPTDHTLTAIYKAHTYTINYNANNATGTIEPTQVTYDQEATIKNNSYTKQGYTFKSWNTKPDGTGDTYNPGQKVSNLTSVDGGTIQLYAIWKDETPPDKTAPAVTPNGSTITVECKQTDSGSGINEGTIKYQISSDGGNTWSEWKDTPVFEGLLQEKEYKVRTQVYDKDGNGATISDATTVKIEKLKNAEIEIHNTNHDGEKVTPNTSKEDKTNYINTDAHIDITQAPIGETTITITKPDGTKETYDNKETEIQVPTVTGQYEIKVTTTDGPNKAETIVYINIDKTDPTMNPTVETKTNEIKVDAQATDLHSGVSEITYVLKDKDGNVIETIKRTKDDADKTATFTGLKENTEYKVEITVKDEAGNVASQTTPAKTKQLIPSTIEFIEETSGNTFTPITKQPTTQEEKVWVNEDVNTDFNKNTETGITTTYTVTKVGDESSTYTEDANIPTTDGDYIVKVTTTDGKNTKEITYYFSVDKIKPTVAINPNGAEDITIAVGNTKADIETILTAKDEANGSGIATTKYAISTTNTTEPTEWSNFTSGAEVLETRNGGKYYIWTNVVDKAGNRATVIKTSGVFDIGYEVAYNTNGGAETINSQRKTQGTSLALINETPTRDGYIFKGWATTQTATVKEYSPSQLYSKDEPLQLYAVWSEVVASTTINGVETNYESVQGAIDAAGNNSGAIVKLIKNEISENVTVIAGQDIVLNTNGKTLTANSNVSTIDNSGTLKIIGNGKIDNQINGTTYSTINNKGNITISEGTIASLSNSAIRNVSEGNITISGGTITSKRFSY